jgi:CheY-like chemotaxis protein
LGRFQAVAEAENLALASNAPAELSTLVEQALKSAGPERYRVDPGPSVSLRKHQIVPISLIVDDAPRILIVEDEYLIALELDAVLRSAGYRVIGPAGDVRAALAMLDAERPDAAILDVNLAGQWVTPVAEILRAASVPFILASGYVAADLQAEPALRDAVNVGKSWRPEFLLNVLGKALSGT